MTKYNFPDGSIITKKDKVDRCAWCNLPVDRIKKAGSLTEHINYHIGKDKEVAKRKLKNKKKE